MSAAPDRQQRTRSVATVDLASLAERRLASSGGGYEPVHCPESDQPSDEGSVCGRMPVGATILVVDDEAEIVDDIVEHLEHLGYATCSATSGAEALSRISDHPQIRVCLTDIRMPEMDGIDLLNEARVRDERRFTQMHWIMLTGHATPADEKAAFAAGAGIFLRKPCSLSEITAAVAQAFVALGCVDRHGFGHRQEREPDGSVGLAPEVREPAEGRQ